MTEFSEFSWSLKKSLLKQSLISPSWLQTAIAKVSLDRNVLLPLPPKCWNCRIIVTCTVWHRRYTSTTYETVISRFTLCSEHFFSSSHVCCLASVILFGVNKVHLKLWSGSAIHALALTIRPVNQCCVMMGWRCGTLLPCLWDLLVFVRGAYSKDRFTFCVVCMSRPEAGIGCLPCHPLLKFAETVSLTEPRAHYVWLV